MLENADVHEYTLRQQEMFQYEDVNEPHRANFIQKKNRSSERHLRRNARPL